MVTLSTSHVNRIKEELKEAGLSRLALLRFTARYLPRVIHQDEHINAAIFGRRHEMEGLFGYVEGILVATNKRVVYVDHHPGYTKVDEIPYEVISGVRSTTSGIHTSLTLFTKIGNYTVSYARALCANKFMTYIETHKIEA